MEECLKLGVFWQTMRCQMRALLHLRGVRFWQWGVFGTVIIGAIVLVPGVHWRLYGWLKGEPFWRGRPATYWGQEVGRLSIGVVPWHSFWGDGPLLDVSEPVSHSLMDQAGRWVQKRTGWALVRDGAWATEMGTDWRALPVLMVLQDDSSPRIRAFAVTRIGRLAFRHEDMVGEVLPAMRRCVEDDAVLDDVDGITVGMIAACELARVERISAER
jgi:hypothetical protein